ncbi:MAG: hypothetical protein FJ211_02785 [Ignavibacteria bacterium]|nr:hypothetical protein [Ignavibacteria bacterium]
MAPAPKRKKHIEIYFVLYLVALVLLMPDWDSLSTSAGDGQLDQIRVELFPEKIRLECAIERDSSGPMRVLRADTVNVIRYSPALNSMKVKAVIEDVGTGQVLSIDESTVSSFASLSIEQQRGVIRFSWSPLQASVSSKTFRVTLQVTGRPAQEVSTQAPAIGQTQFVLTTVVNNQQPPQLIMLGGRIDTLMLQDTISRQFAEQLSSEFWIEPARIAIVSAAGREWANRISIGGADPSRDLQGLPTIRVVSGAQIEFVRYFEQRTLVIKGRTPLNGTSVVEVVATRTDGKQSKTTFSVQTVVTAMPRVPEVAYPGVEVVVDPLLGSIESARAVIREGSREVSTTANGALRFKPSNADTGKVFVFERLIDGQPEFTSNIYVRAFPAPVIREVRRSNDVNVKTITVQFYSADRTANRPTVKIVDGNASAVRKLPGFLRAADAQKPTVSWIEVFEITRKDPSKPFAFRIQAFDEKGRGSAVVAED